MQPGQFAPRGEDWLVREVQNLRADFQRLAAANPFASMGIRPKEGGIDVDGFINSLRGDGTVSLSMDDDGAFVVYDATEEPVARFGELVNSSPGDYGVEIFYNGAWVQVGAGNVDWGNISNIPAAFTPSSHTHGGADITSRVAESEAADGPTTDAFNRVVGGVPGTWYEVYMHSNGDFGRGSSSERYKKNVRDFTITPEQLMALRPVVYDRKAVNPENGSIADDYTPAVSVDELGLIAEEVEQVVPELVEYFGGVVDNVKYPLVVPAMIPIIQAHEMTIRQLLEDNALLKQAIRDLGGNI